MIQYLSDWREWYEDASYSLIISLNDVIIAWNLKKGKEMTLRRLLDQ